MAAIGAPGDFCFVHAADLHLDTPFRGVSETAPHVGAALREASLDAFGRLVELCLERRAAWLLLAGDVYDGPQRGLRAQLRLRDGLERLSDAGIRTFIVHGNHDPVEEGWSAVRSWPALVHVFGHERIEAVPVWHGGEVVATVQGISYGQREVTENLARRFSAAAGPGLQVGVLHCNVGGPTADHANYSPCTVADLQEIGLDYWALGHVHARSVLTGSPGAPGWIVYPGNLQARSPKPSESGAKGATVVEVRQGRVRGVEHVPCDRVRFSSLELEIDALGTVADVHGALVARAQDELERQDGRSLIVRGRLVGRGPAHQALARAGVLDELLVALRQSCGVADPFVWWDRLQGATAPELDLDELKLGDDFLGDLLRLADEMAGEALEGPLLEELLGKMPRELARMAEERLHDLPSGELFHQAAVGALDLLEVGDE